MARVDDAVGLHLSVVSDEVVDKRNGLRPANETLSNTFSLFFFVIAIRKRKKQKRLMVCDSVLVALELGLDWATCEIRLGTSKKAKANVPRAVCSTVAIAQIPQHPDSPGRGCLHNQRDELIYVNRVGSIPIKHHAR